MLEYRAWLEERVAFYAEAVRRHRGVNCYQDSVTVWQLKVEALREALAEFDRLRGADTPALLESVS
jgi:hypothetical protein